MHRLLSLLMLVVLVLQGTTLAAADVFPAESSETMAHCAGHEESGAECACCAGSDLMGMSCTAQCSIAVSASVMPFLALTEASASTPSADDSCAAGPTYSPLNPPPIA